MLGTTTAAITAIIVVTLVRRWMLGATHREVPSVFCSWLTSTAVFARDGCDYLAWAASLYGGDFSVTLMFRTCDSSPRWPRWCTKSCVTQTPTELAAQVHILGLSRVCTSVHTGPTVCFGPPARRGTVYREEFRFASRAVGGRGGETSRHPAQGPVPQHAHRASTAALHQPAATTRVLLSCIRLW